MKKYYLIMALLIGLATASAVLAIDTVKKKDEKSLIGRISAMNGQSVTITRRSVDMKVPAGQIDLILYDGEPKTLNSARLDMAQGRYEDALKTLGGINTGRLARKEILADVEFYKALCAARLALRGEGKIPEAGRQMAGFVSSHRDNYHWLDANQLVADLLVANRQYDTALRYYDALAESPELGYRLRGLIGSGQAELAAGRPNEAMVLFEKAIELPSNQAQDSEAELAELKNRAQIGKARCLVAQGKPADAITLIQTVIDKAPPEAITLNAQAYNALGTALRGSGKPRDALLAFLHVDIIYFNSPEEHAEALANLVELWRELNHTERSIQAKEILQKRYKNSRWATQ